MQRVLPTAMVMGLIFGLLVAGYMNIFNVPVMEWAIELEGKAALAEPASDEPELPLSWATSLGAQRVGMTLGLAVVGVLCGAVFSGLYYLTRRATPGWNPWAWASIAGLLGFWSVSMFTQLKFPLNPPGVGDEGTLLARQGLQFLVIAVSAVSAAAVLYAVGIVNRTSSGFRPVAALRQHRFRLRGGHVGVGFRGAQRARRRPRLAAPGVGYHVPHLHRRRPPAVVGGDSFRHRWVPAVPGEGHPCLPAFLK